jgi:NADH dehydrogenase (ubiquinone) Fe-S protein 4
MWYPMLQVRLLRFRRALDAVTDLIASLRYRTARIYKPTKTTMQSAKGKTRRWLIDWDVLQGAGRWENPLMGWASSGDYMQGTQMAFPTKEEAIAFVSIISYPVLLSSLTM